jgi:glycosyltransferase involved in cell wall biosynthesis
MKIAFVTTNLKGGGAEKSVLRVAGGLHARGHAVHVVLLEDIRDHALPAGVRCHALTAPGEEASKGWFGKRFAARGLRQLFDRIAADAPFDSIVSTLPYCDEVVGLAGLTPAWFRIANTLSVEIGLLGRRSRGKAARRLRRYREMYGHGNLIAVSDGVARDLREKLSLAQANIVRIYNAIDASAVRMLAAESEPELPREPYLIHVGRFAPQKRHDLLLDALRTLAASASARAAREPGARTRPADRRKGSGGARQRRRVSAQSLIHGSRAPNCSCSARITRECRTCCSKRSPAARES